METRTLAPATPGWHHFEVGVTPAGVTIKLDGSVLATNVFVTSFNKVSLEVWGGFCPACSNNTDGIAYFDDFSAVWGRSNICPLSQGFWKNHASLWPVTTLTIGGTPYMEAQLLTVLGTPPQDDAVLILAHQLIASLLDIDNGSDPSPVSGVIADAQSALAGINLLSHPPVAPNSVLGRQMVSDAATLDRYDNGDLTPNCTAKVPGQ